MFEQSFRSVEFDQTCGKGLRWVPPATRIPRMAQSFTMLSFIYVSTERFTHTSKITAIDTLASNLRPYSVTVRKTFGGPMHD